MSEHPEWNKVRDGEKWRWQWRTWLSTAHEFLEDRPWTPQVIGEHLCFCTRDVGKWYVVWGSHIGRAYDDVYDLIEFEGKPLYIAREGHNWLLVSGQCESQRFLEQITFKIDNSSIIIYPFKEHWLRLAEQGEPVWQEPS